MKRLFIAGIALITVPSTLLAQKEDGDKDKDKKKDYQQIIITRSDVKEGKTIIEIDGENVKVNGKDVKDDKDVSVHVNNLKNVHVYRSSGGSGNTWNYNYDNDSYNSLWTEDNNRAMLGVVTEGDEKGAEIQSITKGSGAEKAGLKKGDIITQVGDKKIESTDDVTKAVRTHKPGDKVSVTYLRDGKEQKATAELTKWKGMNMNSFVAPRLETLNGMAYSVPTPPTTFFRDGTYAMGTNRPRLGLSIQDTDDGVGVKVLDVDEDSNAAKAGIKEGDIIVGIDDHEVRGTEDVTKNIRETKDKYTFNFRINRGGKTQNIEVKMPRKLKTADL